MLRRALAVGWVAALAAVVGCGGGENRVPVSKTTGTLVWPNHKLLGLMVVLHPADPQAPKMPFQPVGVVHPDGRFQVTSYDTSDGAPPGEYIVTIREAARSDGAAPPVLPPAKYLDPKQSPLRVTIEKKAINELSPLEINEK